MAEKTKAPEDMGGVLASATSSGFTQSHWADAGELLRQQYRKEEKARCSTPVFKRCRTCDRWYHLVVPMAKIATDTLGVFHFMDRLTGRGLFGCWSAYVGRPTVPVQLTLMAALRISVDAGWFCPEGKAGSRSPVLSSLNLQGSALSVLGSFLLSQTLCVVGQSVRAWLQAVLHAMAQLSGSTLLLRVMFSRWPGPAAAIRNSAVHAAWAAGTLLGLSSGLLPLPVLAHAGAHALDELEQQAQRLRMPVLSLFVRRCYWRWRPRVPRREGSEAWLWDLPEGVEVPHELCCPITWGLMANPVVLHGEVFERCTLERWLLRCPRHPLRSDVLVHMDEIQPAEDMARLCRAFAEMHGAVTASEASPKKQGPL